MGQDAIGSEQVLFGLLRADGVAAGVFSGHAFSIAGDRPCAGRGGTWSWGGHPRGAHPPAGEAKRVLAAAQTAMESWEHGHIDTEQLLFGLLFELPAPSQRIRFGLHADPLRI